MSHSFVTVAIWKLDLSITDVQVLCYEDILAPVALTIGVFGYGYMKILSITNVQVLCFEAILAQLSVSIVAFGYIYMKFYQLPMSKCFVLKLFWQQWQFQWVYLVILTHLWPQLTLPLMNNAAGWVADQVPVHNVTVIKSDEDSFQPLIAHECMMDHWTDELCYCCFVRQQSYRYGINMIAIKLWPHGSHQ